MITHCKSIVILLLVTLLATSCSVSRRAERRGGILLTRNIIKTDRPGISQSDLANFAQPKPNKAFLGVFRMGTWVWDAFGQKPDHRFNRWMLKVFGEQPVLLDTVLVHNSLIPMKQYLLNKGYFNSDVVSSIAINRGKAKVTYLTVTGDPFKFGKISGLIPDESLRSFIIGDKEHSLLKSGDQYDAYLITSERDRITQLLRNSGYYAFNSDYIFFEVDTLGKKNEADLKLIIRNVSDGNAKGPGIAHQRYVFNNIFINTDYPGQPMDTLNLQDTLEYRTQKDQEILPDFYEIYRNKLRLRPEALSRAVFIKPGQFFSQKNVNLTYNRVQNLGLSRYVSINVFQVDRQGEGDKAKGSGYGANEPAHAVSGGDTGAVPAHDTTELVARDTSLTVAKDTIVTPVPELGLLNCDVRMVRSPVSMYTIEAEGTNAGGLMGLGSSVNYRNRNIFLGAETFRVKLFGAFEIKPSLSTDEVNKLLAVFNSLEAGVETGFDFPTLLSPVPIRNLDQNARPKTSMGLGFNYEVRSEYERYVAKLSLAYEWNASSTTRHIFSPIDLSSVSIVRDSSFTTRLLSFADPNFLNQYTNHLVLALKYSYIFSNQNLTDRKNFFYFRINLEPAGNLFSLLSTITGAPKDKEGKYTLFNIRFAQYFRTDWDFRFFQPIRTNHRMAYRVALGVGVPYGNSTTLPFEKGFFAGGANGMRGWAVRSLGPGEYQSLEVNRLENVGDLWAETNVEYRFPIYRVLNGALFTDLGNVWLLKENEYIPGGKFRFDRLFKSMGLDAGMGFRFDFSFFIFRVDGGIPIYNPGHKEGNRLFRFSKFQMRDVNWNFGIGYPF